MRRTGVLLVLLWLLPACSYAAGVIGPIEFDRIWLLNNQRNLIARYHQRSERFRLDQRPVWYLDIDATATSNQTIRTSAGDMEAIMDRIGMYYQDPNYLVLVDWLNLIPQPQTTEGFTYGDAILGYSWQHGDKLRFTLGGRLQTTPRSTQVGGQTVFNLANDANNDSLGGFAHIGYGDWDISSYYSRQAGNQATALSLPIIDTDTRSVSAMLSFLRGAPDRNIAARYELALNHREQISQHDLRSSITVATLRDVKKTAVSNAYLHYSSPTYYGFRYSCGLFHTRNLDTNESLPGAKLGVEYISEVIGTSMGLFLRKNAFGDIDAMVVENVPVVSFNVQTRTKF